MNMNKLSDRQQATITPRQPISRGLASREAILVAAVRVVGREGMPAASLGVIAKEAGTSKPAVLYHFGSRENLLREMANRALEQLESIVDEVASDEKVDDRIDTILSHIFTKENRIAMAAQRELSTLGIRDRVVGERVRRAYERIEHMIALLLPGGLPDRIERAQDLVRSLSGFVQTWLVSGEDDPGPYYAGARRVVHRLAALDS